MVNKLKFGLILFFVSFFLFFIFVDASTYDVSTSSNWNIRIDGEQSGDKLGRYNLSYGDLDNDGEDDLILAVKSSTGYGGRNNINIIYVISNSILHDLSSFGNTIDLANPNNYSLKIVSANNGDYSDYYVATASDLNNNGEKDLIIGEGYASHGGVSSRGAVYVIYDSILTQYSGQTGQILDLSDSNNFNLKFLGSAENDFLGYSYNASLDLNNDGKKDLIMNADNASFTNGAQSGSLYVVYNDLLSTFGGVGTVVDLSNSSNFSIRVDGPILGGWTESYVVGENSDINSDGTNDLILYVPWADNNSAPYSGSMYVLYSTLLDQYSNTGNIIDLANPIKFNLRIDGIKDNSLSSGPSLGYSVTQVVDLDGNNENDLLISDGYADMNGRDLSGSAFVIFDSILQAHLGVGQILDLTSSSDYNLRYDGSTSAGYMGEDIHAMDVDNDGNQDLILDAAGISAVYVIKNNLIDSSLVGQNYDLNDDTNYTDFYTHTSGYMSAPVALVDLNQDNSIDFLFSDAYNDYNGRSDSGSVYIIYNFPHQVTLSSTSVDDNVVLSGNISALDSVTNISDLQYQLNSSDINGVWNSCSANDNNFDSTLEDFTCTISSLEDGNYDVYLRAVDAKSSLTALSHYTLDEFTIHPRITSSGSAPSRLHPKEVSQVNIQINSEVDNVLPEAFVFSNNLHVSMVHPDVKELQKYLNNHGYPVALVGAGSIGQETNKFGALTKKALIKFQQAHNINPSIGFFGPITRGVVNGGI